MATMSRWLAADRVFAAVVTAAACLSVASWIITFRADRVMAYGDSMARELIARRVVDSPTPGAAQFGSVWPPLAQVPMLPFISFDWLYRSGLAGSLPSMVGYVVAVAMIYRLTLGLGGDGVAAAVGAAAFALNPNILYLQSTPMAELGFLAATLVALWFLLRWMRATHRPLLLVPAGMAICVATGMRYEAWFLLVGMAMLILLISFRERTPWRMVEDRLVLFGFWSCGFILFWVVVWNWFWFGDIDYFVSGEYARADRWFFGGTDSAVVGNARLAVETFLLSARDNVGVWIALLAGIGVVRFLLTTRRRLDLVVLLPLALLIPFFVLLLYTGQRPMVHPDVGGGHYNTRFAVPLVALAAPLVGLAAAGWKFGRVAAVAAVAMTLAAMLPDEVIVLNEARGFQEGVDRAEVHAARWLGDHYGGQRMLMQSFQNDQLLFLSGIPLGDVIYEGSYKEKPTAPDTLWNLTLRAPGNHVDWIVMRQERGTRPHDTVWQTLRIDHPERLAGFELVFRNDLVEIYSRGGTMPNGRAP